MATPINPKFNYGDRVRILGPGGMTGRIVELRGPLGGNRMEVYRVRLPGKLRSYTEVREDQLELLPDRRPNADVVGSAREFRKTARFLDERGTEIHSVGPLLMVAAFGIELYLKSLNSKWVYHSESPPGDEDDRASRVTVKVKKTGHELLKLFDALDAPFREGLEVAYLANPVIRGKATVREALAEYNTLFESVRYPYEDGNWRGETSITGLLRLLDLIGDYVEALRGPGIVRDRAVARTDIAPSASSGVT